MNPSGLRPTLGCVRLWNSINIMVNENDLDIRWRRSAMESILVSLIYLLIHIAVIIFVAFVIVWLFKIFGVAIDADVYKWGKIIVMLLVILAVVVWLFSLLGYGPGLMYGPTPRIMR